MHVTRTITRFGHLAAVSFLIVGSAGLAREVRARPSRAALCRWRRNIERLVRG